MEGIRIENASLEISDSGLDDLLKDQGAAVNITGGEVTISQAALDQLVSKLAPDCDCSATVSSDGVAASLPRDGKQLQVQLSTGGLRVEFRDDGLVIRLEPKQS